MPYNKYYKQKKQVSYDEGETWEDVTPEEYQKGALYEEDSPDCTSPTVIYRWVNMDISTDYICDGTTKYYKQKKQVSYDGGQTWQDVTPAEYQRGSVYETQSTDCGYVPPSTSGNYLTTVALEDNTTIHYQTSTGSIYASFDNGETWVRENEVTINSGQKVLWKYVRYPSQTGVGRFSSTGNFNVEGNPMSLIFGDNFIGRTSLGSDYDYAFMLLFSGCDKLINAWNLALPATTLSLRCYDSMFQGCTSLQTAPALPATVLSEYCYVDMFANCTSLTTAPVLPATTLAKGCYCRMFQGCTSLQTAPVLSATTLSSRCYESMFQGCTSLQTAPALPATTLILGCYESMFSGCTSLQTAPILSATVLTDYCYDHMFANCTSLSYIKCLATSGINYDSSTWGWVSNVSSTGTFIKSAGVNWPRGDDGIPTGWTVIDAQ